MLAAQLFARLRKNLPAVIPSGQTAEQVEVPGDVQGRPIVYPYQIRDLMSTAYATLNSNNETTLLAAPAGVFLDLIQLSCANLSTAAVSVDIRDATGGGVIKTISLPGSTTVPVPITAPIPQNLQATTWTVKFNANTGTDLSGTTVDVDALFVQNQ